MDEVVKLADTEQMPSVVHLYRYPVKGLSPEALPSLSLSKDLGLAWDREFAIALGTTVFDEADPQPLDKGFFLMLRSNAELAALATRFDPASNMLTIERDGNVLEAGLDTQAGRAAVEEFFASYLGPATKGWPRLVRSQGHKFTDASVMSPVMMRAISVINMASVRALEEAVGATVHPLRFRGNIYLEGLEPWEELAWKDRVLSIGGVRFKGLERTPRCGAVNVNPVTAARDLNLPKSLMQSFGHMDLGIYLQVLSDGALAIGDEVFAEV
jgi:uncharacterized protein YcbX